MPLQRNVTDHPLDVPAASVTVEPGETLDWPAPIVGFEPVGDPEGTDQNGDEPDDSGAAADPAPAPPPKAPRRRAAAQPTGDEEAAR